MQQEEAEKLILRVRPGQRKQKELRRKIRAEKRAEKIRRLEEELEEEELALTEKDPENISKKQKKKTRRSQKERQAAVKANREGEFNLPSFLDEQKAVLPADTDLTEEDPGLDEKPEEHAQPLEFQIHRSQSQPTREESEEPDFEREMQEAEEEDAYAGYEDVDIPEMQQILPSKTETAVKASGKQERQPFPLR